LSSFIIVTYLVLLGLAEWYVPQGGMFLWVKIAGVNNVSDFVMNKCVPKGVFVVPGNAFSYNSSKPDCHLRLSYSYSTPEDMDKVNFIIFNYLLNVKNIKFIL